MSDFALYGIRVGTRWLDPMARKLVDKPVHATLDSAVAGISAMGLEGALLVPVAALPNEPAGQLRLRRVCVLTLAEAEPSAEPEPIPEATQ